MSITSPVKVSRALLRQRALNYVIYIVLYKAAIDISLEEAGRFPLPGLRLHFTDHNLMSFINEKRNLG